MKRNVLALLALLAFSTRATAHHLDDYDARIRSEARLPEAWFICQAKEDCTLVGVPCQSDLAVNSRHVDDARDALVDSYPFCLGTAVHDTAASCRNRRCVTEPADH